MRNVGKEIIKTFRGAFELFDLIAGMIKYLIPFVEDDLGKLAYEDYHHEMKYRTGNDENII